jgi:hypothetical protein
MLRRKKTKNDRLANIIGSNIMENAFFCIGIIGHRYLGGNDVDIFVQTCCHKILSDFKWNYPNLKAVSALSQGADSIFAQSAISLNIELDAVIPFDEFQSDFFDETAYETYRKLRNIASLETKVNFVKRSNLAYKKSMDWVVFKSNFIIVVWDGKKEGSTGGTWEAIKLCEKLHKKVVIINISTRTMGYTQIKQDKQLSF